MINRRIIFSYKKDDLIQFLPIFSIHRCPDDFPTPPGEIGHYPYFLDFQTKEVTGKVGILEHSYKLGEKPKIEDYQKFPIPDHIAQNDETSRTMNEVMFLVNSLSLGEFFTYGTRQCWTICYNKDSGFSDESCYGQEGYHSPDYETKIEKIQDIENYEYIDPILFTLISGEKTERIVMVRLRDLLNLYFSFPDDTLKRQYLNACVVYSKSLRLADVDMSASYIFLVSTIEALIEIEYRNLKVETCESCGQPKYKVRKKFHAFIEKYGYKIDKKTKDYCYEVRSGIAHSGQLLGMSYDHKWAIEHQEDFDLKYKTSMDRMYYDSLKNLVQTCLRTFLYENFSINN